VYLLSINVVRILKVMLDQMLWLSVVTKTNAYLQILLIIVLLLINKLVLVTILFNVKMMANVSQIFHFVQVLEYAQPVIIHAQITHAYLV